MISRWTDFDAILGVLFWTQLGREKGGVTIKACLWCFYGVESECLFEFHLAGRDWECIIVYVEEQARCGMVVFSIVMWRFSMSCWFAFLIVESGVQHLLV